MNSSESSANRGWQPFCNDCTAIIRMKRTKYGFKCTNCGAELDRKLQPLQRSDPEKYLNAKIGKLYLGMAVKLKTALYMDYKICGLSMSEDDEISISLRDNEGKEVKGIKPAELITRG
jgi:predicted RNA-binding Zn-ribbon protein involved in translation (DUF1610 family)